MSATAVSLKFRESTSFRRRKRSGKQRSMGETYDSSALRFASLCSDFSRPSEVAASISSDFPFAARSASAIESKLSKMTARNKFNTKKWPTATSSRKYGIENHGPVAPMPRHTT